MTKYVLLVELVSTKIFISLIKINKWLILNH